MSASCTSCGTPIRDMFESKVAVPFCGACRVDMSIRRAKNRPESIWDCGHDSNDHGKDACPGWR